MSKRAQERRERQRELAGLVHTTLASGSWETPGADFPVCELGREVCAITDALIQALEAASVEDARRLACDHVASRLDAATETAVKAVIAAQHMAPTINRAREYRQLVRRATCDLLAHPLPVDPLGEALCGYVATVVRDQLTDGKRRVNPDVLRSRLAGLELDCADEHAVEVVERAVRDRRRYDRAVKAGPGAFASTPLVRPGNLRDDAHCRSYEREFGAAIPSDLALRALGNLGSIIQVEAGNGYWAQLLRERRTNVLAYDATPARRAHGER